MISNKQKSNRVILTAMTEKGLLSGTYDFWADIYGSSVASIQKRNSTRNKQIREGVKPYTFEEVVGRYKLAGRPGDRVPIKPKVDVKDMLRWFNGRRLVKV